MTEYIIEKPKQKRASIFDATEIVDEDRCRETAASIAETLAPKPAKIAAAKRSMAPTKQMAPKKPATKTVKMHIQLHDPESTLRQIEEFRIRNGLYTTREVFMLGLSKLGISLSKEEKKVLRSKVLSRAFQ